MSIPERLAPGESPEPVDPAAINTRIYRGAMWELFTIGRPLPAFAIIVLLVVMFASAVMGMAWPSIIGAALLVGVAIWAQRNVPRWAEEHNARVRSTARTGAKPQSKAGVAREAKRHRATRKAGSARRDRRRP